MQNGSVLDDLKSIEMTLICFAYGDKKFRNLWRTPELQKENGGWSTGPAYRRRLHQGSFLAEVNEKHPKCPLDEVKFGDSPGGVIHWELFSGFYLKDIICAFLAISIFS